MASKNTDDVAQILNMAGASNFPVFARNGRSTYRQEAAATRNPAASTTVTSKPDRLRVDASYLASESSGQCHKYSEYEICPMNTKGLAERMRVTMELPIAP